jgi:hypothetical protein
MFILSDLLVERPLAQAIVGGFSGDEFLYHRSEGLWTERGVRNLDYPRVVLMPV